MNGLRHGRPPSGPRSSMIQKSRRSERTCGKYTVEVNGMMCGMCEAHVNDAVRKACPVKKVSSSRSKNQTVILSETELDTEAVMNAIRSTGYEVGTIQKEPYKKRGLFG